MRKKLFAVIMSAMMMITFMPAMAFAGATAPEPPTRQDGYTPMWQITNVNGATVKGNDFGSKEVIYDGLESEITLLAPAKDFNHDEADKFDVQITYYTRLYADDDSKYAKVDTPKFKDVGKYSVQAHETWKYRNFFGVQSASYTHEYTFEITARPVLVSAKNSTTVLLKEKNYDKKGLVISDADFNITPLWDDAKKDYVAVNTGLVAGDTLFTAIETPADAAVYELKGRLKMNTNYAVKEEWGSNHNTRSWRGIETFKAVILKADNAAKIGSQVLTIKRGSSKAVTYSATFGTAKLTKLSGNTKISVKNGKIKVAKSCKKGTFKVKVKASVAGNANYASASRVKTLTIKVK